MNKNGRIRLLVFLISIIGLSGCMSMRPTMPGSVSLKETASIPKLQTEITARADDYDKKWKGLEGDQWNMSENILEGGAVGAAGVLAQSMPVAAFGALWAGYGGVINRFYGQDKQNLAYTKAAHGLRCGLGLTDLLAQNEKFLATQSSPESGEENAKEFVFRKLKAYANETDQRLEDRLRIEAVSTQPDWSSFQTAMRNAATTSPVQPKAGVARLAAADAPSQAIQDAVSKAVARYSSDLDGCKAMN